MIAVCTRRLISATSPRMGRGDSGSPVFPAQAGIQSKKANVKWPDTSRQGADSETAGQVSRAAVCVWLDSCLRRNDGFEAKKSTLLQGPAQIETAGAYIAVAKARADPKRSKTDAANLLYLEGQQHRKQGRRDQAATLYRQSLRINPASTNHAHKALQEIESEP